MENYTKSSSSFYKSCLRFSLILTLLFNVLSIHPVQAQDPEKVFPEYIVQEGDTLLGIANRFNVNLDELLEVNEFRPDMVLYPLMKIKIPGFEGLQGVLSTDYVSLGTSLQSLSRRSKIELSQIVRLNYITSPSELFVGRELLLTDLDQNEAIKSSAISIGNSFLELAIKANCNPWTLSKRNLLNNANYAIPQDSLFIPGDTSQANAMAIPGIGSISIGNLPLKQGDTYFLTVSSPNPIAVSATLAKASPQFTDLGNGTHIAFAGIHALTEPGVYPLNMDFQLSDGSNYRFEQMVIITSGNYATDPPLYVEESTIDADNIRAEEAVFKDLTSKITPTQQWQDQFVAPCQDPDDITSSFGSRRTYNNDPTIYYHTGLDFGYNKGTEVYATARGTVVGALPNLIVRGNTVIIDHGLGVFSIYLHLSQILVDEGDTVEPGQLIGIIGTTGRSTGPHLHFEIDIQGTPVNPATWLKRAFP